MQLETTDVCSPFLDHSGLKGPFSVGLACWAPNMHVHPTADNFRGRRVFSLSTAFEKRVNQLMQSEPCPIDPDIASVKSVQTGGY